MGRSAAESKPRVLVADDDAPIRSLLSAVLTRAGCDVTAVQGGASAIAMLGGEMSDGAAVFDLLLLDLMMPPPDGLETLRRVRERFARDELPVVVLSAVGDADAVVAALEAGANDYVPKPFDAAVLRARVETHVTLRRQAREVREAASRMRRDLDAAAAVQRATLPEADPAFGPYRFAWRFEPSEVVSGDGLGVFPLSERHVGFYVLDAEGHGVRAGLVAAAVGGLLLPAAGDPGVVSDPVWLLARDLTRLRDPAAPVRPSVVLARLARRFRDGTAGESFVTLLYGLLDTATGEVLFASAGHPPPFLAGGDRPPLKLGTGGLPIGAHGDLEPEYEDVSVTLRPGGLFAVYSDGLTEARSESGELLGADRLLASAGSTSDAAEAAEAMFAASDRWSGAGSAGDDRTLLVLARV